MSFDNKYGSVAYDPDEYSRRNTTRSSGKVNNGGWLHWWWFEMLLQDKLDFDFIAYHWYSEMGDMNNAGGEDVWAKLASFGKDIWITELDRRGGSSSRAPCTHPRAPLSSWPLASGALLSGALLSGGLLLLAGGF